MNAMYLRLLWGLGVSLCSDAAIVVASSGDEDVSKVKAATKSASSAGREVLERSASALKKIKAVTYQADYGATGWIKEFVPQVTASVILGTRSKWDIDPFYCDLKLKKYESEEVLDFRVGSDGDVFFFIDPRKKMAYEDMDPLVLGDHSRDFQRPLMRAFAAPNPFEDELKSDSIEIKGDAVVNGVSCVEVLVKSADPPDLLWAISKDDFLPRRVLRTYPNRRDPEGESGTTELTIKDLKVNPKFPNDPFQLRVPEGYTKTDEFPE